MKIVIEGYIVANQDAGAYRFWGYIVTCPNDIIKILEKENGKPIDIEIRTCYGGDIWAGSEIYTALKAYKGEVNISITGLAASAASVIAMAGHCKMSPTAQMIIHNVQYSADGDYHDMDKASELCKVGNNTIVNAYLLKTGMKIDDLLVVMDDETWLTAQKALDMKLIDEIMFAEKNMRFAAAFGGSLLPTEVLNKTRAIIAETNRNSNPSQNDATDVQDPGAGEPAEPPAAPSNLASELDKMKLALQLML